jgi:hypothetical protein
MDEIQIEWIEDESNVREIIDSVEKKGGKILEKPTPFEPSEEDLDDLGDAAFEPMTIIAISLGIGSLVKLISDLYNDHKYPGGEVIDIRGGKLRRTTIRNMEKGSLLIISDKGAQKFSASKRSDGLAILEKALRGLSHG